MTHTVVRIDWIESERGWGQRPDGYSLHLTVEDCKLYVDTFVEWQRHYYEKQGILGAPDEYSATVGRPYFVDVDEETYQKLLAAENKGLRFN